MLKRQVRNKTNLRNISNSEKKSIVAAPVAPVDTDYLPPTETELREYLPPAARRLRFRRRFRLVKRQ